MKDFLRHLIINNWPRKGLSLVLAVIIWLVVDQSLTTTKSIPNVPIRVINIPKNKTVEGMQANGFLNKKITVTVTGRKTVVEDLTSNDFEIVVNAYDEKNDFVRSVSKKTISSLNPDINLSQDISKVSGSSFIVKLAKLSEDKIPIFVTPPIGEPPKGYQFLDIWPYQLYLTVSGPEDTVKQLKARGLKLTFNLNDISKAELDHLQPHNTQIRNDVVSFYVPNQWKQIYLPSISKSPMRIDDPDAKYLRIDFVRSELVPVSNRIPINIFIPPQAHGSLSLEKLSLAKTPITAKEKGQMFLTKKLYAKGVSDLFVEIVKDRLQFVVSYDIKNPSSMMWSVQFVNPQMLEDRYVSLLMSDASNDEVRDLQPVLRQDYLRNRFRNYMNRFQLFTEDDKLLDLNIQIQDNSLSIEEKKSLD